MIKEVSLKDYEKEMQRKDYEAIYRDIVNKSIELVKEIGKIKEFELPDSEDDTTLFYSIKCYFEQKVNYWKSVIELMSELIEWESDDRFIAPTEKEKLKLIFSPYNRAVRTLNEYKEIKKEIEVKGFEIILKERKEKIIGLYTEMLDYKNKTNNRNWNIEEFTPIMDHYYNFYHHEFSSLRNAIFCNHIRNYDEEEFIRLDDVERIMSIDEDYEILLPTDKNKGYKEFAYKYRDFELKEGQTYKDLYILKRKKLIELFKKMLEFVGENDFVNEDDYDKLKDKVIEKYPFYSSKLANNSHYVIERTWIEILSDLEDVYEELSSDYKNREENLKRYEELKKSVQNEDEDEDIDFWN